MGERIAELERDIRNLSDERAALPAGDPERRELLAVITAKETRLNIILSQQGNIFLRNIYSALPYLPSLLTNSFSLFYSAFLHCEIFLKRLL